MVAGVEVTVPDIGDFDAVEVIEILVAAGDSVAAEDPLITLESDKATMDIPAPQAGVVEKVLVEVGQMVAEGTAIAVLVGKTKAATKGKQDKSATKATTDAPA